MTKTTLEVQMPARWKCNSQQQVAGFQTHLKDCELLFIQEQKYIVIKYLLKPDLCTL